jgi:hypothetical protein
VIAVAQREIDVVNDHHQGFFFRADRGDETVEQG